MLLPLLLVLPVVSLAAMSPLPPDITSETNVIEALTESKLLFTDCNGNVLIEGTSEYITSAQVMYGSLSSYDKYEHYVMITFTDKGRQAFKSATEKILSMPPDENSMLISVDGELISAPRVFSVIDTDSFIITGSFTKEEAYLLADSVNAGLK